MGLNENVAYLQRRRANRLLEAQLEAARRTESPTPPTPDPNPRALVLFLLFVFLLVIIAL